jgi:Kef-type K+ transport system membrane component KefB
VEDLVQSLTRGNPGSVKTVLASVVLALAAYQLVLAAIGYRMASRPALLTHRASRDAVVVLVTVVALFCVGAYGFDDAGVHAVLGVALAAAIAVKVAVVRRWLPFGGALPYLGTTVFALLAATCFTSPWFDS